MNRSAHSIHFKALNEEIRQAGETVVIDGCLGQRFIGSGLKDQTIVINGTPGNALGAYLNGAVIHVRGNAQDAVGDTMNSGRIIIHGHAGDTLGYAMRGGSIYVSGHAGYRTGIHMKAYKDKQPVIIVGGHVGSFLGEYLAGGLIIVLGIGSNQLPVGHFTGTGMHGGKIFIRSECELNGLPDQVVVADASADELSEIQSHIEDFASCFQMDASSLLQGRFHLLKPNRKNLYHQLYVAN